MATEHITCEATMNIEYLIVGLIALAVGVYLTIALLWPDRF
ncbi:MAG: potassium-transporting ATPase subunit F [Ktedonobacterales bacterium]